MPSISVLITCSPESPARCINALDYCKSLLEQGSTINQIFFYQAGVYHANGLVDAGSTNLDLPARWSVFAANFGVPLLVCVGAATQRGIIDAAQAGQTGKAHHSLFAPFEQVGLGEFFTRLHDANKLVQF
ncbi:sulfurtransferase complex subunit TusD [Alteromonas gilva]|uniref:Sulfurtransferase complex subunit TusD n=1 Tax=Alteromonas gilva TaxID=2987522 RepID=A0ABT5L5T1_9ALTE|nr:sulfurtransferase complex subunit TusD [Alteromonas gilva]MDC8831128.1 sulfurtransferase complex subunit TusD [Alteromonas gilva]